MNDQYVIGVDVGTGSARAGLFSLDGKMLSVATHPIQMWKGEADHFEQSGDDVWNAVCLVVKQCVAKAGVAAEAVTGLGFDATCSLVLVGKNGQAVAANAELIANRNIIVWMDQRAKREAATINAQPHEVLKYVGGRISPEMQTPKLLWLKRYLPDQFAKVEHFFDLSDYLTWRSTGSLTRSTCTVTCKWTYLSHEKRFDAEYFKDIGLGVLAENNFDAIGTHIVAPGEPLANGLSGDAATAMGLQSGIAVGAGLIDAHAGALGTVDAKQGELAYIFGTSACMLINTPSPQFVEGVWGPYFEGMIKDQWLLEGGQSTAGAAIDQLLKMHPAYAVMSSRAAEQNCSLIELLEKEITERGLSSMELAKEVADLHIIPDFLGNRSPHANPDASAIMCGAEMSDTPQSLQRLYVASVLSVAYSARQTVQALLAKGVSVEAIVISGGAGKSPLVRQLLADATGLPVKRSEAAEPVLLGSAMLAARAAGKYATLEDAMKAMRRDTVTVQPSPTGPLNVHDHKYRAYGQLQDADRRIGTFENHCLMWAQGVDQGQQR